MQRLAVLVTVATMLLAGCSGNGSQDEPTDTPTTTATTPEPITLDSLVIAPGAVGPVQVGSTEAEALETGLFLDEPFGADLCEVPPAMIRWKPEFEGLDLRSHDGVVLSIGVTAPGPHTVDGIEVGSTMTELLVAYDEFDEFATDYNQTGVLVSDGDRWIGFLFDEAPGRTKPASRIRFIEVAKGDPPGLVRDGC